MTAPSTKAAPEPATVTKLAAPRHNWLRVPTYIHRDKSVSGCDETERECEVCGLVKITVHAPNGEFPYRAWRNKEGLRFSDPGYTPVCEGAGT